VEDAFTSQGVEGKLPVFFGDTLYVYTNTITKSAVPLKPVNSHPAKARDQLALLDVAVNLRGIY
jgi:hypothetical protein